MDPIAFLPSGSPSTLVGKREVKEEFVVPQVAVKNDPEPMERSEIKREAAFNEPAPEAPVKEEPSEEPKLPIPYDL
jgi:hypothetical protein